MSETDATSVKALLADAKKALSAGEYAVAKKKYETLAELGSKEALLALGCIFERGGVDVEQDMEMARHWFERAWAEGQLVYAARALARMHYLGEGVPVDFRRSYSYLAPLEDTNNAAALFRLAVMYELGRGVPKDTKHARALYRRSARLNNIYARKNLGVLEVKRGNILIGFAIWGAAALHIISVGIRKKYDPRLLTW